MPVTPSFRAFVLEQLSRVAAGIRARGMFGGVGIYADDLFFALIDDDTLYFKTDDSTRQAYVDAGAPAFMPGGMSMGYHQVPADVLEDDATLAEWTRQAIAVGHAAKKSKPKSKPRK